MRRTPTGKLRHSGGTGKLKSARHWAVSPAMVLGGFGIVVLVSLAAGVGMKPTPEPPFAGAGTVMITAPSARTALAGTQMIKLKVSPEDELERLELTIDGKYWDKLNAPPFTSEWATKIFKNGSHILRVRAIFRGGKVTAVDQRTLRVHNPR